MWGFGFILRRFFTVSSKFVDNFNPFESSLFRIQSAKADVDDIEARLQGFRTTNGKNIIQRIDPDTGEHVLYVRFSQRVSTQLRRQATNIISEGRHALDDAMSDAAVQLGRSDGKGVYFPTCEGACDLEGEIERKCRKVDPAMLNFVRVLEPYKHGKGELIWAMSKFAGVGKHRSLLPLTPTITKIAIQVGGSLRPLTPAPYPNTDNEFAIAVGSPGSDEKIGIAYDIGVNAKAIGLSFDGNASIRDIVGIAERIVLGLKAETERIIRMRAP